MKLSFHCLCILFSIKIKNGDLSLKYIAKIYEKTEAICDL